MEETTDYAQYVAFEEFRAGLPAGRFRVVVDPKLARRYVSQRLLLIVLLTPLIGIGIALALIGARWTGGIMVVTGVVLHRLVMWQAPHILLHMAVRDAKVYDHATQHGLIEVRRAG
jgi:hypothetical protein